jgi:HEAT repeat protein
MTRRRKLVLGVFAAALVAAVLAAREAAYLLRLPSCVARRMPLHARIPCGLDADVRAAIEDCYSADADTRARAAHRLGNRAARSAPAVPQLVALLADEPQTPGEDAGGLWGVDWAAWADTPLVGWLARMLIPKEGPGTRRASPEACAALTEVGPAAVDALLAALKDPLPRVRMRAATALANIADPRAVEPLIALLADNDYRPGMTAALALGQFADERAARALDAVLHKPPAHEEAWVVRGRREAAAQALAYMGPAGWESLLAALKDADADVRSAAALGINMCLYLENDLGADVGERVVLARALLPLLDDADEQVAAAAIDGLGCIAEDWATEALFAALIRRDEPQPVEHTFVRATGAPHEADIIAGLLHRPGWRTAVALRLATLGDRRAAEPLLEVLDEGSGSADLNARNRTIEALGRLREPRAVPALVRLMAAEGGEFKVAYLDGSTPPADALVAIGPPAVELLVETLNKRQAPRLVAECLGRIGDARAVPALVDALRTGASGAAAQAAAKALGRMHDDRVVPALLEVLRNDEVRANYAAAALGRTGDARALAPLVDALTHEDDEVADCAAEGLGWLGDARAIPPLRALLKAVEAMPDDEPQAPAEDASEEIASDDRQMWGLRIDFQSPALVLPQTRDWRIDIVLTALLRLKAPEAVAPALERWRAADEAAPRPGSFDHLFGSPPEPIGIPQDFVELLAAVGPPAVPALARALDDDGTHLLAFEAIIRMDCPEARAALAKTFDAEDRAPCAWQHFPLNGCDHADEFHSETRFWTAPAATLLAVLAGHKDRYVREAAADRLCEYPEPRVIHALRRAVAEDPCPLVRRKAAEVLRRLTGEPLPPEFPPRRLDEACPLSPVLDDDWY